MPRERIENPGQDDGGPDLQDKVHDDLPGYDWELSSETLKAIEDINANIRSAEQKCGKVVLR